MTDPVVVDVVFRLSAGVVTGWGWDCMGCPASVRPRGRTPLTPKRSLENRQMAMDDACAHAITHGQPWRLGVDRRAVRV